MSLNSKKAQSLVEYLIIGSLVAIATLPLISPYAKQVGQKIADSAPAKSPVIKDLKFTSQTPTELQSVTPTPPNINPVNPKITPPDDPVIPPPVTPPPPPPPVKLYAFSSHYRDIPNLFKLIDVGNPESYKKKILDDVCNVAPIKPTKPMVPLRPKVISEPVKPVELEKPVQAENESDWDFNQRMYQYNQDYQKYQNDIQQYNQDGENYQRYLKDYDTYNQKYTKYQIAYQKYQQEYADYQERLVLYQDCPKGSGMAGLMILTYPNGDLYGVYPLTTFQRANDISFDEKGGRITCSKQPQFCNGKKSTNGLGLFNNTVYVPNASEAIIITRSVHASPLAFDIDGKGIRTSDKKIWFDINGDGKKELINDVLNGVLCIRGGKSGLDLFGDNTDLNNDKKPDGYKNGFEALKALAKKENLINFKNDMKLDSKDLALLEKKYNLKMKIVGYYGKLTSLKVLKISEINLGNTSKVGILNNFDNRGNMLMTQQGATFKVNGIMNTFADVWHKIADFVKNTAENIKNLFTA